MVLTGEKILELDINELQPFLPQESFDDRYALEILQRALVEQTDEAWSALQHHYSDSIRVWIRSHPRSDLALLYDSEENYIAQTFSRFWCAMHFQQVEFNTLPAALSYLRATLNGVIIDTLRFHLRYRSREMPLPEPGISYEPSAEDSLENKHIWEGMLKLLYDERERRLFHLLYYCGLKPRDIVAHCSQEFSDVKDVYRLNHNIIERLRRNGERLCYLYGSDE